MAYDGELADRTRDALAAAGAGLDDAALDAWVHRGLAFTTTLPPK